jgi:CheY-like chemotaxis protein
MVTDEQRLNQILKNLLSNAFKFTDHGSVELSIRLADKSTRFTRTTLKRAKEVIAFDVTDTGTGIPREKQDLIFEAFQQADTTTARKHGGTGLGLTISRELARLLGGELALKSEVGVGSTFSIYLPIDFEGFDVRLREDISEVARHTKNLVSAEDVMNRLEGLRVLLVDDDPRSEYALTQLLESRRVHVRSFNNAPDAIDALMQNPQDFDLVMMDIVMPGMNGFEAIEKIRSQSGFKDIPILAFSGKSMPGDREKCMLSGCSEYVSDPAASEHLLTVIAQMWMGRGPSAARAEIQRDPAVRPASVPTGRVLKGRSILIVDDEPRNLFAVTSFLESRGAEVTTAESGREALELLHEKRRFDMVLIDIMMPEMDGYEVTRKIRSREEFRELPILAVTAKAMAEDQQRALDAGCTDFVPKPVNNDRLLIAMMKYLRPLDATADL